MGLITYVLEFCQHSLVQIHTFQMLMEISPGRGEGARPLGSLAAHLKVLESISKSITLS